MNFCQESAQWRTRAIMINKLIKVQLIYLLMGDVLFSALWLLPTDETLQASRCSIAISMENAQTTYIP